MLKKHLLSVFLLSIASFFFVSCSKSSDTTGSNNNNNGGSVPTTPNTMNVTVDGSAHTGWATVASKVTNAGMTVLSVVAFDASTGNGLAFGLNNITTTGSYDIGKFGTTGSGILMTYNTKNSSGDALAYSSGNGLSSVGTMVVTELTATSIKATFSGTLTLQSGTGPNTVSITNGGVNATIK